MQVNRPIPDSAFSKVTQRNQAAIERDKTIRIEFVEPVVCPVCQSNNYSQTLRGSIVGNQHLGNNHLCLDCGRNWEYI